MASILVALLSISGPVPIPNGPPVRLNEKKLEGIWIATEFEKRGEKRTIKENIASINMLVILDNKYYFSNSAGLIEVDHKNKTLDMKITEGKNANKSWPVLFDRTGNTLRLAIPYRPGEDVARPTEMKAGLIPPGSGGNQNHTVIFTFELDTKSTPTQVASKLKELTTELRVATVPPEPPLSPREQKTQEMLQHALDKLNKLEKRIEELEKKKDSK